MIAAIASHYSVRIIKRTRSFTMIFLALLVMVSYMILGTVTLWVGVFAITLQQVSRGFICLLLINM